MALSPLSLFTGIFLILALSFNVHATWLLYDALALGCMGYYFLQTTLNKRLLLLLFLTYMAALWGYHAMHLIGILSVWDNVKHIFVAGSLFLLCEKMPWGKVEKYTKNLGGILNALFVLEMVLVAYQYQAGYQYDDTAGSFGYGASHSIGYFCLLTLAYRFYHAPQTWLSYGCTGGMVLVSLLLNYASENMGFYPILLVLITFRFLTLRNAVWVLPSVLVLLLIPLASIPEFLEALLYRYGKLFEVSASLSSYTNLPAERSILTQYAWSLGGLWGVGPGGYSEIYGLTGPYYETLWNSQIMISSVSGILAEYGLIALIGWGLFYVLNMMDAVKTGRNKMAFFTLFSLSFFYSRLLMDERLIYMLILTFVFIKIAEMKKLQEKDLI